MIDEKMREAIARLTENERICLIRRLKHQTAKEMAIELGVSPHAVEKRLKMARAKLGVSSSLEAAQLLVASEHYGRTGPQMPDLCRDEESEHQRSAAPPSPGKRAPLPVLIGVTAMIVIAALLSLAPGPSRIPVSQGATESVVTTLKALDDKEGVTRERPSLVKVSPEKVREFVNESFDIQDKDHSGFLERDEAPARGYVQSTVIRTGPMPKPGTGPAYPDENEPVVVISGVQGQAAYIASMDKDADGKVSREEFMNENFPRFTGWGVPAQWRGIAQTGKD